MSFALLTNIIEYYEILNSHFVLEHRYLPRSYARLQSYKKPSGVSGTIWNVNTRGRRGNIVQAYPAVEYGFYPSEVTAEQGSRLHFQFHGSDFNQARNPNNAEGWQYSDRTNLVQMQDSNYQFPMDWDTGSNKFFKSEAQAVAFALLDSKENLNARNRDCEDFEAGDDNENNDPQNCGKLNYASALWQPGSNGLFTINHERQKFSFVSTRNNNFSNRSQKFMVRVTGLQEWEVAVISISVVMAVLAPIGGFLFWAMYMKGWDSRSLASSTVAAVLEVSLVHVPVRRRKRRRRKPRRLRLLMSRWIRTTKRKKCLCDVCVCVCVMCVWSFVL